MTVSSVIFRVDASLDIGTGHVMRCLALADSLRERGVNCRFVCREHPGNLLDLIRKRGYEALALMLADNLDNDFDSADDQLPAHIHWLGTDLASDADQTLSVLGQETIDWMIVDHYAIDANWERVLRHVCSRIMVIDDLADRTHDCDLLLDQNWFGDDINERYDTLLPSRAIKLLGPKYALLTPEYAKLRGMMPERDGIVRRVLVFLGGSDQKNITAKVLEAMMAPDLSHLEVDVVLGVNHPDPEGIKVLVSGHPATCLHQNLPSLAGLMARADLMIGGGGSTTWERMSLGLPCIVISIAANQTATNVAMLRAGYINYIGELEDVTVDRIVSAVKYSIASPSKLKSQSVLMQEFDSGPGVGELCNILMIKG